MKSMHYTIQGRVQGVGFRYFAAREAQRLGLSGWVRNLPGGGVEARAEGDEEALRSFEAARNRGPSWSRVTSCLSKIAPVEDFTGFKIKW